MSGLAAIFITAILSYIAGIFTRWPLDKLAERRAFVRSIADRYIEKAQQEGAFAKFKASVNVQAEPGPEDEFWRIGTLQSLGAAELRPFELGRVCRRIVSCGLSDPRQRKIYVFKDSRRDLLTLLRWAARKGISLSDAEGLMRIHAEEMDAANQKSA